MRLRRPREESPFRVPFNLWILGTKEWPIGLWAIGVVVGVGLAGHGGLGRCADHWRKPGGWPASPRFSLPRPAGRPPCRQTKRTPFRLLPSTALSLEEVRARPGGVLVAVRNPHSLAHVAHAIEWGRGA